MKKLMDGKKTGKTLTQDQKDLLEGFGILPGMDQMQIRKQMKIHRNELGRDGYNQVEITKYIVYVNEEPFTINELREALPKG